MICDLMKTAAEEFAPGIPKKRKTLPIPSVTKPTKWKFGLQFHEAEKAGPHFDLRIGDNKGNAHSWALRSLPSPGEKVLAVQQPTHTVDYMPFKGRIESGYGKGDVSLVRFEPAEVQHADSKKVTFHLHKGHKSEEFSLIHMKNKAWLLVNHTTTRKSRPNLPTSKPSYREIPFEQVKSRLGKPEEVMAAKIDGGHNTFELQAGRPLRIFSYRPAKKDAGLIEHTHRVQKAYTTRVPAAISGTILRGELYARDKKTGKPLPAATVGGMLNANVWLSRERQKVHGPLRAAIFDVVKWRGKNVENAPYAQKMEILKTVKKHIPWLEIPDTASTPTQKARLLAAIKSGKHPQTREGVVFWNTLKGTPPVKSKILEETDVRIKGFEPGKGRLKGKGIGAILYGTTKSLKEVKGKVGTGLSMPLREHMHQNPDLYKGKLMKVKSQGAFPSGALRAPRFLSMHLDTLEGGEKVAAGPPITERPIRGAEGLLHKIEESAKPGKTRYELHMQPKKYFAKRYGPAAADIRRGTLRHELAHWLRSKKGKWSSRKAHAGGLRGTAARFVEEFAAERAATKPMKRKYPKGILPGGVKAKGSVLGFALGSAIRPAAARFIKRVKRWDKRLDQLAKEKVAARVRTRKYKVYARSADDVVRALRKEYRRRREMKEKRASGFQDDPTGKVPISEVDGQGRLRTNDEPDVEFKRPIHFNNKNNKDKAVKRAKKHRPPLRTNADEPKFKNAPTGVTPLFRTNAQGLIVK